MPFLFLLGSLRQQVSNTCLLQGQLSRTKPIKLVPTSLVGYNCKSYMIGSSGEAQQCFLGDDGFWRCNFVVRNGKEIRSKTGKWLKFPALLTSIIRNRKLPKEVKTSMSNFQE